MTIGAMQALRDIAAQTTAQNEELGIPYVCPSCGDISEELDIPDGHNGKCDACGHVADIDEFLGAGA